MNKVNKSKRRQNERKFEYWEEFSDGSRQYWYDVPGQQGWSARYLKKVDDTETTLKFWQEIYNEYNELVEIHVKYPVDTGHQRLTIGGTNGHYS